MNEQTKEQSYYQEGEINSYWLTVNKKQTTKNKQRRAETKFTLKKTVQYSGVQGHKIWASLTFRGNSNAAPAKQSCTQNQSTSWQ